MRRIRFAALPEKPRLIFLGLGLALLLAACGRPSPRQEIEQVLDKREQALARKDLAAYMALISPAYSDRGKTYRRIEESTRKNFAAFSRIELHSRKRSIYVKGDQAAVVQEYVLSYWVPSSGKHSIKDKERLVLRREAGGWKFIRGL